MKNPYCGENVCATNEDGATPLHFAALGNETENAKRLLEGGADFH